MAGLGKSGSVVVYADGHMGSVTVPRNCYRQIADS